MADTLVLGTSGEIRASSSLAWGTKIVYSDRCFKLKSMYTHK